MTTKTWRTSSQIGVLLACEDAAADLKRPSSNPDRLIFSFLIYNLVQLNNYAAQNF